VLPVVDMGYIGVTYIHLKKMRFSTTSPYKKKKGEHTATVSLHESPAQRFSTNSSGDFMVIKFKVARFSLLSSCFHAEGL